MRRGQRVGDTPRWGKRLKLFNQARRRKLGAGLVGGIGFQQGVWLMAVHMVVPTRGPRTRNLSGKKRTLG